MNFIGIDPGKSGCIAVLDKHDKLTYHEIPKIGTEVDIRQLAETFRKLAVESHFVIMEDVHAVPGAGAAQGFNFGQIVGVKKALLIAMHMRHALVSPKTWQKLMWQGIPNMKKSDGKNDTKAMSYLAFQRIFPNETIAKSKDGHIDAALMAMYGKLTYKNL